MRTAAILLVCLVLAHLTAAKFGPTWDQLHDYTFQRYVDDFGLEYRKGSEEWTRRKNNFERRLDDIRQHNADPSMTWKRGINQFSDWSHEEFHNYNRAGFEGGEKYPTREYKAVDIESLPKTVDYRTSVPPVLTGIKNQAACGNCWSWSTIETVETYFAIQFGQLPVLSAQQVTSCTVGMDGCGGGTYWAGWEYIQQSGGLNEEWVYPFVNFFCNPPLQPNCTQKCMNVSKQFTSEFKWWPKANVSSVTNVKPNDASAMMEAIANVGPQSIAVASDPWADYESGILQNNYTNFNSNMSWQAINHAVQIVGYGYDFDLGMNYWTVRNSWGTNYGEDGYIRLARPAVEPCGNLTGIEVCGTSALLRYPAHVSVSELKKKNHFYF